MAKVFSLADIKNNKDGSKTLMVIHDKVIDVSKFLEEHPGGEEVLLEQAGQNATDAFEDVGHSFDARDLMKDYIIGTLCEKRGCSVTSAQTSYRKCVFCENNAVFFCYQCKAAFCQICRANYHDKLPVSKDHTVIDFKRVNLSAVQLVCGVHKSEYTYYCVSCKTLVCSTCVTTDHIGHDMSEIKQKAEEIKKIARSKLFDMKEKLQRLSKLVEITNTVHIPHLDEESEDAIESIRKIKADLDKILQTKVDIKINEIQDSQQWRKEELQSTYHNKERTFHKQTAVCESLETLLSEDHAVSFLLSYQTLEKDLFDITGDILEDAEPKDMKPPNLVDFLDDIVFSIQEYKKGKIEK